MSKNKLPSAKDLLDKSQRNFKHFLHQKRQLILRHHLGVTLTGTTRQNWFFCFLYLPRAGISGLTREVVNREVCSCRKSVVGKRILPTELLMRKRCWENLQGTMKSTSLCSLESSLTDDHWSSTKSERYENNLAKNLRTQVNHKDLHLIPGPPVIYEIWGRLLSPSYLICKMD